MNSTDTLLNLTQNHASFNHVGDGITSRSRSQSDPFAGLFNKLQGHTTENSLDSTDGVNLLHHLTGQSDLDPRRAVEMLKNMEHADLSPESSQFIHELVAHLEQLPLMGMDTRQMTPSLSAGYLPRTAGLFQAVSDNKSFDAAKVYTSHHLGAIEKQLAEVKALFGPELKQFLTQYVSSQDISTALQADIQKLLSEQTLTDSEVATSENMLKNIQAQLSIDKRTTSLDFQGVMPAPQSSLHTATIASSEWLTTAVPGHQDILIPSRLGSQKWIHELSDQIVFANQRNINNIDLHLNPPELGALEVMIKVGQEGTTILFQSNQEAVREALASSLDRLKDMMADHGMSGVHVDVGQQSNDHSAREDHSSHSSSDLNTTTVQELLNEHALVDYYV